MELRPEGLYSLDDLARLIGALGQLQRELPGPSIYCVDWRRLRVLSPDVATALANGMREGNSRSLRSAALIGSHATLALQLDRVIREANHPSRRIFREPEPMLAWLGEVMTRAEFVRAREFIDSFMPPSSEAPLSRRPARVRLGS